MHGIAAFASLHVSVVFTAAVMAHLLRLPRVIRAALWAYLLLTALATVYFGWHYVVDVAAGAAVGALAIRFAARATRSVESAPRPVAPVLATAGRL